MGEKKKKNEQMKIKMEKRKTPQKGRDPPSGCACAHSREPLRVKTPEKTAGNPNFRSLSVRAASGDVTSGSTTAANTT